MATTTAPRKSKTPASESVPPARRKRALITGASSGIGEEFARQLVRRGYDVVLTARRKDRLDALAEELALAGATAEVLPADLSAPDGVAAVVDRIGRGDITLLVNNAGFGIRGRFGEIPIERELEELDLNIRALTQLAHAALLHMKDRGKGTIINVGSTGSYVPVPYMATYAATKAYVLSFSEALHEEAKHYGITVTCLCPGGTRTEFQAVAGVEERNLPRFGFMDAEPVVAAALDGARNGSAIVVPGLLNKATANLPRFTPRFAVRRLAAAMFERESAPIS
jgi:hypothetical protein